MSEKICAVVLLALITLGAWPYAHRERLAFRAPEPPGWDSAMSEMYPPAEWQVVAVPAATESVGCHQYQAFAAR
jgi:hypothetical protein